MAIRAKATFRANGRGMRAAGRSEGVYRDLERRADRVIDLALEIYAPHRKTGDYGRGLKKVRTRVRGKAAVQVVATDWKSDLLERGSPPHVIEPRAKKALAWPGGQHPVRRVQHPGTPALHILRRALRAAGR
ncbi:hypothetical protein Ade02nite_19740 [Paractinoplanes deccanensis]|uniref:HK97 gp10 family phage protein n=1 Tax=Paractinoplanes deccanensis TaxID=113561 RepID=A0ABQ3Y014_9ACTN|nr:hypothetical protein [Actinoplanes deccanensis]GID73333.1 hypothetical protein Ade02nite_19740 [Actinoplanes deccanensis]